MKDPTCRILQMAPSGEPDNIPKVNCENLTHMSKECPKDVTWFKLRPELLESHVGWPRRTNHHSARCEQLMH